MIHFTSDTHFSHANILRFCPDRPGNGDIKEMNNVFISNWNKVVSHGDTVYHLGDIIFNHNDIRNVFSRLNGRITFLNGNHDRSTVVDDIVKVAPDRFLNLKSPYHEVNLGKGLPSLVLNHYPMRSWNKSYHGSIHMFGHVHGKLPPLGKSVDVGVDSTFVTGKAEYRPFSLSEVLAFMEKLTVVDPITERMDD